MNFQHIKSFQDPLNILDMRPNQNLNYVEQQHICALSVENSSYNGQLASGSLPGNCWCFPKLKLKEKNCVHCISYIVMYSTSYINDRKVGPSSLLSTNQSPLSTVPANISVMHHFMFVVIILS